MAVTESWPETRFDRIRAGDGGVTARRRPRGAAAIAGHSKHGPLFAASQARAAQRAAVPARAGAHVAAAAYAMLIGGAEVIAHFLAAGFAAADFFFAIATEGWKSWRYEKAGQEEDSSG